MTMISDNIFLARYFDGNTSTPHDVEITLSAHNITIKPLSGTVKIWQEEHISIVSDRHDLNLHLSAEHHSPNARLVITDQQAIKAFHHAMPQAQKKQHRTQRMGGKVLFLSFGVVMAVVAMTLIAVPLLAQVIAPRIPKSVEIRIGQNVRPHILTLFSQSSQQKTCIAPKGVAALSQLVKKIEAQQDISFPLNVIVIKSDIANAFALPGGYVVILSDIFKESKTPDEFAGVLAHEIGHIHHQHSMKNLIAAGGYSLVFSTLFGDFTGSTLVLGISQQLLQSGHTREAEIEADHFAGNSLHSLGADPSQLGVFLQRLDDSTLEKDGEVLALLRSHPYSSQRMEILSSYKNNGATTPILNAQEWKNLQAICEETDIFTKDANSYQP